MTKRSQDRLEHQNWREPECPVKLSLSNPILNPMPFADNPRWDSTDQLDRDAGWRLIRGIPSVIRSGAGRKRRCPVPNWPGFKNSGRSWSSYSVSL